MFKVSIPSSSYVGATLATALQVNLKIITDGFLANNDYFTITYDYDTNKIYINLNCVDFSFRVLPTMRCITTSFFGKVIRMIRET